MNDSLRDRMTTRTAFICSPAQVDAAIASRCTFEWRQGPIDVWQPRTKYLRTLAGAIKRGTTDAELRCVYPESQS